ncbi:MAG: hypothetical protein RL373_856, partial [Pseudomonadota bacterium]
DFILLEGHQIRINQHVNRALGTCKACKKSAESADPDNDDFREMSI